MSNGDPDFESLSKQLDEIGRRVTALEGHRRTDAEDRKRSQDRIERQLAGITDTDNPRSLVSKVDAIGDLVQQFIGVAKVLRWIGAGGTLAAIAGFAYLTLHTHP